MRLRYICLIFLVLLIAISFFLKKQLYIGKDHRTGQFSFELQDKDEDMSAAIKSDIQPDKYIIEHNHHHPADQQIQPWEKTYNSKFIYNIFSKVPMGEGNAISNFVTWRMVIAIDIFMILVALYLRKKLQFIPSKAQLIFEMVFDFIEDLVIVSLGEKNRKFLPFFLTLFLFIWVCNWSSMIPIPGIVEPTRYLNITVGLGLMTLGLVHYNALKKKGIVEYVKGFCEPVFLFAPLNIVGELAKVVSISFRLFGNIFGGAIIAIVVTSLTKAVLVPIGLNLFFTMFAGTIQAFVFTMLAVTYLSLEITD